MFSLESFNAQLVSIMNDLAKAVIAELKLSTALHADSDMNEEEEGKLDTFVRIKCIEASNMIMTLIGEFTDGHDDLERPLQSHPETSNQASDLTGEEEEQRICTAPLSEEDSSLLGPAVDLDHHYIRSSTTSSVTVLRERDRSAAREARKKLMKTAEAQIIITKSSRVQHVCKYCGMLFSAVIDLRDHERHVHRVIERPYACDYCDKTFSHKPHRDRHHRLHRGEKMFQCEICGKAYTTISQLKTHKQTHSEKSFICDICGNAFYQSGHLTRHKLVHEEVKPFHCETCGKGFTQAEGLRNHQITHTGERQLCPICGKAYRNLKHHMINKHADELPAEVSQTKQKKYSCEVSGCGKTFLYPSLLNLHRKRTHARRQSRGRTPGKELKSEAATGDQKNIPMGERAFICGACGATFNTASNLSRHSSIHTGETPFSCSDCGKRFRLLDFLKTHEKVHLKHKQAMPQKTQSDADVSTS
ncbi:uncharacterized protein ACJ7VT_016091 [Polymixia lowei]